MNAMLAHIDGAYIANQIRMLRSQDPRAVLVVEGITDELFFERLTDPSRCRIDVAIGRENALEALDALNAPPFTGVLFILDADFDVVEGKRRSSGNLLLTDSHDRETMLIASPALDKVIRQVGQKNKVAAFQEKHGSIRDRLLASGEPIGLLLLCSIREGHNLRFEDLKYGKFIDDKTLVTDEQKMIKAVLDHSNRHDLDPKKIAAALRALRAKGYETWHVVCGHHLTEILAIALRKALGSGDAKDLDAHRLEDMLALAYEAKYFRDTLLYTAIRAWERQVAPFAVLPGEV